MHCPILASDCCSTDLVFHLSSVLRRGAFIKGKWFLLLIWPSDQSYTILRLLWGIVRTGLFQNHFPMSNPTWRYPSSYINEHVLQPMNADFDHGLSPVTYSNAPCYLNGSAASIRIPPSLLRRLSHGCLCFQ
jgi:hypothetical protein